MPDATWAAGPLGRWAAGPLGRWAAGPLGRWAAGPLGRIIPRDAVPVKPMSLFLLDFPVPPPALATAPGGTSSISRMLVLLAHRAAPDHWLVPFAVPPRRFAQPGLRANPLAPTMPTRRGPFHKQVVLNGLFFHKFFRQGFIGDRRQTVRQRRAAGDRGQVPESDRDQRGVPGRRAPGAPLNHLVDGSVLRIEGSHRRKLKPQIGCRRTGTSLRPRMKLLGWRTTARSRQSWSKAAAHSMGSAKRLNQFQTQPIKGQNVQ